MFGHDKVMTNAFLAEFPCLSKPMGRSRLSDLENIRQGSSSRKAGPPLRFPLNSSLRFSPCVVVSLEPPTFYCIAVPTNVDSWQLFVVPMSPLACCVLQILPQLPSVCCLAIRNSGRYIVYTTNGGTTYILNEHVGIRNRWSFQTHSYNSTKQRVQRINAIIFSAYTRNRTTTIVGTANESNGRFLG